jgi:hypothetical protein
MLKIIIEMAPSAGCGFSIANAFSASISDMISLYSRVDLKIRSPHPRQYLSAGLQVQPQLWVDSGMGDHVSGLASVAANGTD